MLPTPGKLFSSMAFTSRSFSRNNIAIVSLIADCGTGFPIIFQLHQAPLKKFSCSNHSPAFQWRLFIKQPIATQYISLFIKLSTTRRLTVNQRVACFHSNKKGFTCESWFHSWVTTALLSYLPLHLLVVLVFNRKWQRYCVDSLFIIQKELNKNVE